MGSPPAVPGYELQAEIGRGAMGVVYQAVHRRLNRPTAVKMILGGARAGPRQLIRFLAEAEVVAAIRHPHVVQVYEYGEADGHPYLAMEYLPGGNLAARLGPSGRSSPLPASEAASLLVKVARGIAAAHELGIVHRDLKPGNVLLDAAGEPKVTDFGLAKQKVSAELTGTREILGTPAYMAPEQARGESRVVGPEADVWALGVILYECLTGQRPFAGEEPWSILQSILSVDPPSPRQLVPGVPRDLETICLKCLAKERHRRYASAAALADDLERFLAGEPVAARPVGPLRRTYVWLRRRPAVAVGLLAAVVTVTLAAGLAIQNARDVRAARIASLGDRLLAAQPVEVVAIRDEAGEALPVLRPRLEQVLTEAPAGSPERLNAALALAESDPRAAGYLLDQLPQLRPSDLGPVSWVLRGVVDPQPLWVAAEDRQRPVGERLRFAAILARIAPGDPRWPTLLDDLVPRLVLAESPADAGDWARLFAPIREPLRGPLVRALEADPDSDGGYLAATLLARLFGDDAPALAEFLDRGSFRQAGVFIPALATHPSPPLEQLSNRATRPHEWRPALTSTWLEGHPSWDNPARGRARSALALLAAGRADRMRFLLENGEDPRVRTYLVHHAATTGVDPTVLLRELDTPLPPSARQAVLLALAEYRLQRMAPEQLDRIARRAEELYRRDPDPGVHTAADRLLRVYGRPLPSLPTTPGPSEERDWYVAPHGQTFAVLRGPIETATGSSIEELAPQHAMTEDPQRSVIPRTLAVATTEVTVTQFRRMLEAIRGAEPPPGWGATLGGAGIALVARNYRLWTFPVGTREQSRYFPTPDCPHGHITWWLAMCYCRWLGEIEGLPEEEQCYPPIWAIFAGAGPKPDYVNRRGYRLPTETEWEYFTRARTRTPYFFGTDFELLGRYGWHDNNTNDTARPVGLTLPNAFGLFDTIGNAHEWCHGIPGSESGGPTGLVRLDNGLADDGAIIMPHMLRGVGFSRPKDQLRSAYRRGTHPHIHESFGDTGMRVVRTVRTHPEVTRAEVAEVFRVRVEGVGPFQIQEVFGPATITPQTGVLPAELTVRVQVPPGWVREEFSFAVDCPHLKERLWVCRPPGKEPIRFVPQRVNSLGMVLSLLPAGEFVQGTPAEVVARLHAGEARDEFSTRLLQGESPPRPVRFSRPLGVGTTEVPVRAFRAFAAMTGYYTQEESDPSTEGGDYVGGATVPRAGRTWWAPGHPTSDDHPAVCLTHADAVRFCEWLTTTEGVRYRLPTEPEWEYAARGGTSSLWPWGDNPVGAGEYAWFRENIRDPQPVGTRRPNRFGLHDMLGNVGEWCLGTFREEEYQAGPVTDPVAATDPAGHVLQRGEDVSADPVRLRPGRRFMEPGRRTSTLCGFRVVCDPWEPRVRGSATPNGHEFRAAPNQPAIPLRFDDPAALPPFVLVPAVERGLPTWFVYPRHTVPQPGDVTAFAWDTASSWRVTYLDWRPEPDPFLPITDAGWTAALHRPPLGTEVRPSPLFRWDYNHPWYLPDRPLGLVIEGEVELPAGVYEFRVHTGNGHKVFINGVETLRAWAHSHPCANRADVRLPKGRHTIRIETFHWEHHGAVNLRIRPLRFE